MPKKGCPRDRERGRRPVSTPYATSIPRTSDRPPYLAWQTSIDASAMGAPHRTASRRRAGRADGSDPCAARSASGWRAAGRRLNGYGVRNEGLLEE